MSFLLSFHPDYCPYRSCDTRHIKKKDKNKFICSNGHKWSYRSNRTLQFEKVTPEDRMNEQFKFILDAIDALDQKVSAIREELKPSP